jgi:small multidrug resistance pump
VRGDAWANPGAPDTAGPASAARFSGPPRCVVKGANRSRFTRATFSNVVAFTRRSSVTIAAYGWRGEGDSREPDLSYLFLAMAVLVEVVATSALKASAQFTRPMPALVVVVGYGTAFYCLSLSLNQLPLGIAYAIWAGVGTALIALLGCVLFRRALNPGQVIGILLIVAGVGIINLSASGR